MCYQHPEKAKIKKPVMSKIDQELLEFAAGQSKLRGLADISGR
jgi:hypothetical protein